MKSGNRIGLHHVLKIGQFQARTKIPVRALFFLTLERKFRSIIYRRNAIDRVQQDRDQFQMLLYVHLGRDPLHIMVVHKRVQAAAAADVIDPADRMRDLKIIVIIVSGIQALVQLIIGHRMQGLIIGPSAVIPVDHFAHQPEILLETIGKLTHLFHELEIQYICCIQTDSINIKVVHPHGNAVKQILTHLRIPDIELDQEVISSPVLVGKSIVIFIVAAKIQIAEPTAILRILPVLQHILKGKETASHMVKHSVHDHAQPDIMTILHKIPELIIGAKAAVHQAVISGLIAMSH